MRKFKDLSSSSSSSSSSSLLILVIVIPLALISAIVIVSDPKNSSWFTFSSSPWKLSGHGVSGSFKDRPLELRGRLSGVHEEAVTDPSSFNRSSLPPTFANETIPTSKPDRDKSVLRTWNRGSCVASASTKVGKEHSNLERVEAGLARARATIREATHNLNQTPTQEDVDFVPQGPIYRNSNAFHRSYLEMEKLFKIFVYEEGEPPLFHNGPCKSIYSMEGNFIHAMELENHYRTRDPDQAHVYFLPFSVVMMVHYIYKTNSFDLDPVKRTVIDYVNVVANKYPYWNRSLGADHFMLSCHDWGPETSKAIPNLYNNSIRVLCNANSSEGFNPSKDASLPEINLLTGEVNGIIGGLSPSHRPILAFFAGGMHGYIRKVLLEHWENKDKDLQVYQYLPKNVSYYDMMRKSRFCLCPSGYEVASPRVVEAIYLECVPVIISDHYVLPFSDVLNYNSFSVQVPSSDIPNLKKILMGISDRQYIRMQRRVKLVQRHFVVNSPPKRYDVFHMIIHSVWLRRLNIRIVSS